MAIFGNMVGGASTPQTYEIIGEDGATLLAAATPSGNEVILTAGANDIRSGKIAATSDGIVTGSKDIYITRHGYRAIASGNPFSIPLSNDNQYDYMYLQCIIAPYNTSPSDSIAVDMVVFEDKVYETGSTTSIATVTKNETSKSIDLNIGNANKNYIIHYITYKLEE